MQLFDSHCHLTSERFGEDLELVLQRAAAAGVLRAVSIASTVPDARAALSLAAGVPGLWSTAGIHPHDAEAFSPGTLTELAALFQAHPELVAVGETGLDYFYDNAPREVQLRSLEAHVHLSEQVDRPLVIHCRDADQDMIQVIRSAPATVSGVLHCFVGDDELLETGLAADWYVSFSGIASFKNFQAAERLRRVPMDRLLIETDAPYLAPVPMRGKRNEPAFVVHTCHAVAAHLGRPVEEIARVTTENALRFYGLPLDAPVLPEVGVVT